MKRAPMKGSKQNLIMENIWNSNMTENSKIIKQRIFNNILSYYTRLHFIKY